MDKRNNRKNNGRRKMAEVNNFAEVASEIVVNISLSDAQFASENGLILCDENAEIGGTYTEQSGFVRAPVEPETLSDEELAIATKAECNRRINMHANESGQFNVHRKQSLGRLTPEENQTIQELDDWVDRQMLKSRELISAKDQSFADDRHWEVPSQAIMDLIGKY